MTGLVRVIRRVTGTEPAVAGPLRRPGHVVLGQPQPGPLGRNRVEQPGGARGERLRFGHGVACPAPVAGRLADPGQGHQPGGQRRSVHELTAQRDPPGHVLQGPVEIVPLIGDLTQPDQRRSGGWPQSRSRLAGRFQGPLARGGGGIEAALAAVQPGQAVVPPRRGGDLALPAPPPDAGLEGFRGGGQPSVQPFGHGLEALNGRAEHEFVLTQLLHGFPGQGGGGRGVTAQLGRVASLQGQHGAGVHQQAALGARTRLEWLLIGAADHALGRFQKRLHGLQVTAHARHLRLSEQQPGARTNQILGQRRKPALDGGLLAPQVEDRVEVLLDQPGRPLFFSRRQSVADRLVGQPLPLVPPRGVPVQAPGVLGVLLQPGPEEVGEQVVVAPPAPDVVELHHEQTGPVHLFEQLLAVIAAGDRVTQRPAETIQDRRLEEEVPEVLSLAAENLLGQVVKDVPVAAGEGGHETGHVGLGTQRQRRQLQAHGPAFGAFGQRGRYREVEIGQDLAEQLGRLVEVEPEIGGAHLAQLAPSPVPGQAKGRIGTAGYHHAQLGRTVIEQEPDRCLHAVRADQVVVVEYQQHVGLARLGHDVVDQRADQRVVGRRGRRTRQRAHPLGDARAHHVESGQHVTPEPHRVVVSAVERQPGGRLGHAPDPLRQQDRLAVTRRGGHQHQPAVQPFLEPVCQPAARHQSRPRARHLKLGSQQHVPLGRRSIHTTASTISSAVDALLVSARRRPRCHFSLGGSAGVSAARDDSAVAASRVVTGDALGVTGHWLPSVADGGCVRRRLPAENPDQPAHRGRPRVSDRHRQPRRHPEVVAVGGRKHLGIQGGSAVAPTA